MMILIFESSYQVKTSRRNASFISYDSPSLSFLYSRLEGWEIDFMEGTVAHDDVYLMTVFLLVIEAVMLYAG